MFQPGGFWHGNSAHERIWKTESGKAELTSPERLLLIGDANEGIDRRVDGLIRLIWK
jgi:hypothetical protein